MVEAAAEIEQLREEVETWRDAYEAEHQDHEATIKAYGFTFRFVPRPMTERTALDQIRRLANKVDGDLPFRKEGPLLFVRLELSQAERNLIAGALTALYDIEANR